MTSKELEQSPILVVVVQLMLYVVYVLALWLLFRGHQQPGGGFVAGLVVATAIALQGMTFGLRAAHAVLPLPFHILLGIGLGLAALATVGPVLFGYPVLKSAFGIVTLPLLGDVEWSTAAVFDIGVFLVVVGAVKAILLQIAGDVGQKSTQAGNK